MEKTAKSPSSASAGQPASSADAPLPANGHPEQPSEQKLLLHMQQTLLGIIEWNPNFEAGEWSAGAERIFGYSKPEALGRHISFITSINARQQTEEFCRDLVQQQSGKHGMSENLRKDGRLIFCEWFNSPLIDSQGRVSGVASLVQDVTERKQAEDALRVSEERYRQLFERNLAGVYWMTFDGQFVDCNESF